LNSSRVEFKDISLEQDKVKYNNIITNRTISTTAETVVDTSLQKAIEHSLSDVKTLAYTKSIEDLVKDTTRIHTFIPEYELNKIKTETIEDDDIDKMEIVVI